ncbi:MAG TPA: hypothetical protein VNS09_01735 [Solirubrobacter sp.]|nr:hypothetical protein [Solirubrobacter sp.]
MHIAALLLSALLTVATGPAESITTGSAVVTGTVNPGGEATTYQFDYGTTTAYGLSTPQVDAGAGTDPVAARATLTNLTENTTYHYRVTANGTAGADRTFRTSPKAQPPSVTSRPATGVTSGGATVAARVNPRGLATSVRFEYGTSTSYGSSTPEQALPAGSANVDVSAPIGGLRPGTKYHFRAVATSAAGVRRGGSRSFTTPRAPTAIAVTPSTVRPVWGTGVTFTGTVSNGSRTPVALEKQDFPYTGGFTPVATATTNSRGAFTLTVAQLFVTARLRVLTRTAVPVVSPTTTASVAVKVGLRSRRLRGQRVRIEGSLWPAVPHGRVSLQRRSKSGRWIFVRRGRVLSSTATRSRYRVPAIRRVSRARSYRVVVLARDGGAHVPGTSRTLSVPKRARS